MGYLGSIGDSLRPLQNTDVVCQLTISVLIFMYVLESLSSWTIYLRPRPSFWYLPKLIVPLVLNDVPWPHGCRTSAKISKTWFLCSVKSIMPLIFQIVCRSGGAILSFSFRLCDSKDHMSHLCNILNSRSLRLLLACTHFLFSLTKHTNVDSMHLANSPRCKFANTFICFPHVYYCPILC